MVPYDHDFFPPAPVATIKIWNLENQQSANGIPMAIDTGADLSLVPKYAIDTIIVSPSERIGLMGFDGNLSEADLYEIGFQWLGKRIRGKFAVIDRDMGILGRNVLNQYRLLLDDPALTWGLAN